VFCSSDLVSDDEVPIPCLHFPPPRQPSAHGAAPSLADSDDELPIMRNPPLSDLVSFDIDDKVFILRHVFSVPPSHYVP
jgi:hypothetical protein